jgi:hypothetical protein
LDGERIACAVELIRFPVPNDADHLETYTEAGLVRAADLIGQLADPYYPGKCVALFYEFEEIGTNKQRGYSSPDDLLSGYPAILLGCHAVWDDLLQRQRRGGDVRVQRLMMQRKVTVNKARPTSGDFRRSRLRSWNTASDGTIRQRWGVPIYARNRRRRA